MTRIQALRILAVTAAAAAVLQITAFGRSRAPVMQTFPDPTGEFRTYSSAGFDGRNLFFQSAGTNGRSCVTCHQPNDAWTIIPSHVQARFDATGGLDPIFRTNDGSNSPLAHVSTVEARRDAYSMLLTKGLIRVGISIPANAEFELVKVEDPYGYAGNNTSNNELSLFRRPLPTTNLAFLTAVMWDGRETFQKGSAAAIHCATSWS